MIAEFMNDCVFALTTARACLSCLFAGYGESGARDDGECAGVRGARVLGMVSQAHTTTVKRECACA